MVRSTWCIAVGILTLVAPGQSVFGQIDELSWPPQLPDGQSIVSVESADLLAPQDNLKPGVQIAKTAPKVDLIYYPEQNYEGHPWSVWGDGLTVGTKYFSAVGDHLAPQGNAFVFEYDSKTSRIRTLASTAKTINLPE